MEIDLFEDEFADAMISVLRENSFSAKRKALVDAWEAENDALDKDELLAMIEAIGKGRFAQRLISHMGGIEPPSYIADAINFVAERV